jgi:predicted PurR-regulated permease PerM
MKKVLTYTGYILAIALLGYLVYRFHYMITWIIVAAMLSFIGQPMVKLLDRIKIWKFRMPRPVSALLALFVIVLVIAGLFAIFVPLIIKQAENISSIDVSLLNQNLQDPMEWLNQKFSSLGAIPAGASVQDIILEKIRSIVNISSVGTAISSLISAAGNIFIGLFSILFISFFFLKDENLFMEGLFLFVPDKHHEATRKVVSESKSLLIRYYLGVLLQVLAVTTLITLGLKIFGIKNALLIGFFAGIMNIIPYIGPIIGGIIGITLGVISMLTAGAYSELLPVVLKIAGTLIAVNIIDNNILVPVIYSKSVKSHPLEIFLVIIIGGGLAGLAGMLFAVPVYTLLRVIAKEFFNNFRVVRKLTDQIDSNK